MRNRFKTSIFVLGLLTCVPLAGCQNNHSQEVEHAVATINLRVSEGGTANFAHGEYHVGDKIHILTSVDKGYSLAFIKVNGEKLRPYHGEYVYQIETPQVNIEVLFELNKVLMSDFDFIFDNENHTATIKSYKPDNRIIPYPFVVPETVVKDNVTYKINKILRNALATSSVEKIVLSKNITDIETETFNVVSGLAYIDVVEDNPVFSSHDSCLYSKDGKTLISVPNEYSKTEIKVKEGTEIIGPSAFMGSRLIETVVLPNSVATLQEGCMMNMSSLTNVKFSSKITAIPSKCFTGDNALRDIEIPQGIETIGDQAFYFCADLTHVKFPNSLKIIGKEAFYRCQKLTDVVLNQGLEVIKSSAFGNCLGIDEIVMPNTLKRLESAAFETCGNLKKCTLNQGLEYLGGGVFTMTYQMRELFIPKSVTEIGYNPLIGAGEAVLILEDGIKNFALVDGVLYNKAMTKLISVPYSFVGDKGIFKIPSTVTELGYNAFSMNLYLTHVIMPVSLNSMNCSFAEILPNPATNSYCMKISYEGTIMQFKKINHGIEDWNFKANFLNKKLYCKDGYIELEDKF